MIDIETKIKKAFVLSDLLYSRERDRISSELKKDLPKISNSFESRGIFYSGMHVDKIFNIKLEAIKQFVNFRITLDMQEVNKIVDLITVKISEIIFERVLQLNGKILQTFL